ncbi:hypothetical protein Pelo_18671 [Pelomyxa schiedti]|nr:hypothetical protein Pelo_18671 [Pelomyxa schiedti]
MHPTSIDESEKPPNVSNITDLTTATVGDKQSHKCTSCSKAALTYVRRRCPLLRLTTTASGTGSIVGRGGVGGCGEAGNQVVRLLWAGSREPRGPPRGPAEWQGYYLQDRATGKRTAVLTPQNEDLGGFRFATNGKWLVFCGRKRERDRIVVFEIPRKNSGEEEATATADNINIRKPTVVVLGDRWKDSRPQFPRVGSREWFKAAHDGDSDALRRLLAGDRDLLNSVDNELQRVTALHTATWAGKPQCVEFLLSMNVDVNSQVRALILRLYVILS